MKSRLLLLITLSVILTSPCFAGSSEGEAALKAGDYSTALTIFRPLAEQGDASAQYNLAKMYLFNQILPQDDVQFALWARKAADQGFSKAYSILSHAYQYGKGVTQDDAEAKRWTRKAVESRFTRVPASGSDTGSCLQDNETGLMWEVKTTDGGLRDWTKTYTNYDSTVSSQKWNGDILTPSELKWYGFTYIRPTQAEIDASSNSVGFKNSVNGQGLCGFSDWRLPSAYELDVIVENTYSFPGPAIDVTWFPNKEGSFFWSASPDFKSAAFAWLIYFDKAVDGGGVLGDSYESNSGLRSASGYLRLVRSVQ